MYRIFMLRDIMNTRHITRFVWSTELERVSETTTTSIEKYSLWIYAPFRGNLIIARVLRLPRGDVFNLVQLYKYIVIIKYVV